ncbi:uncharacterized protein [Ptychodera flava]|uniref:uncharacterized protein n=1 Tax=Ptychodera flava TaxID=63121 RepID=UPI00396A6705
MQAMSIASSEPKDLLRELKGLSEFTKSQFSSLVSTFPLSDEQVQQLGENKYSVCNFIDYWGKMNPQPKGRHLVKVLEKDLGRKDIGEVLRKHFPSGTAGPKGDDEARLLNMPFKVRQKLIAVLSVRDSNAADPHDWRAVADRIGLDGTTIMLFGQTELPMERVFKAWDVRDDATIGNLYTILVELGMPVYADYL